MKWPHLSPKQDELVREMFEAFSDRDFPTCNRKIFDLGMTLGHRVFTFILVMGIGSDIESEPSLQVCLFFTISNLRTGDRQGAESVLMMNTMTGKAWKGWLLTLVGLSLRQVSFEKALGVAKTNEQRFQAHYYEAEGLVTDRKFSAALAVFRKCAELPGECCERELARARVEWLEREV